MRPRAWISRATPSAALRSLSVLTTMSAPAPASFRAIARPMLREAPVTRAVFPASDPVLKFVSPVMKLPAVLCCGDSYDTRKSPSNARAERIGPRSIDSQSRCSTNTAKYFPRRYCDQLSAHLHCGLRPEPKGDSRCGSSTSGDRHLRDDETHALAMAGSDRIGITIIDKRLTHRRLMRSSCSLSQAFEDGLRAGAGSRREPRLGWRAEFSAGDNRHAPNAVRRCPCRQPGSRLDPGTGATPRDRRAHPLQPGRLVDAAATRSHQGAADRRGSRRRSCPARATTARSCS